MTHDECIDAILAQRRRSVSPESSPARSEVEAHLADCSDCWAVVELLHQETRGEPAREHSHMEALYGCQAIRDRLHALIGLSAPTAAALDPIATRHLGWCNPCRERLAVLTDVEREAIREPLASAVADPFRAVRAATARAVIAVGRMLATFTTLEGLLPLAPMIPATVRGDQPPESALVAAARLATDDSDGDVELRAQPRSDGRVDLEIRLHGTDRLEGLVWLRTADRHEPVGCETARGDGPVVFSGVPPGKYLIELPGRPTAIIALDVESSTTS